MGKRRWVSLFGLGLFFWVAPLRSQTQAMPKIHGGRETPQSLRPQAPSPSSPISDTSAWKLLDKKCSQCHTQTSQDPEKQRAQKAWSYAPGQDLDPTTLSKIQAVMVLRRMPPDSPDFSTSLERKMLLHWITQKLRNSPASGTPRLRPNSLALHDGPRYPGLPTLRPKANPIDDVNQEILALVNQLRTDPKSFVPILENFKRQIHDNIRTVPESGARIQLDEGISAVDEAIAYVKTAAPVKPLTFSLAIQKAARDLLEDQAKHKITGHVDSQNRNPGDRLANYGTPEITWGENISYGYRSAMEIVLQLLIDDGVKPRGHRTNLMNPNFGEVGISTGKNLTYGFASVMDFAGSFTPHK